MNKLTITITRPRPEDGSGLPYRQAVVETDLHPGDLEKGDRDAIRDAASNLGGALFASGVNVELHPPLEEEETDETD